MGVEIINMLKRVLKGISTVQGVLFNHHTRHEDSGGDEIYANLRAGLDADKPAAGKAGRAYWAIDTGRFYQDDGTNWVKIKIKHAVYM